MNIIYDLEDLQGPLKDPVLTIGNFDGVHKGHIALFEKVKERARAIGGQSAVMTFEPHPVKIMKPTDGPALITPISQKLNLIWATGIDVILCTPFNHAFASISAQDFIQKILLERIGIREVVVGYDYTFGNQRKGNIDLLREMGAKLGYKVHVMGALRVDDTLVSSTSIRKLIQEGKLREAQKLLGRNYQICGTVIKGKNRGGRLLGFPTANLDLVDELVPRSGVYAVTVVIDDREYLGVTSIGYNPTFHDNALAVETHLLDFAENIVGKTMKVNFLERLRDEKTFKDIKELADQIAKDIQLAKGLFERLEVDERIGV